MESEIHNLYDLNEGEFITLAPRHYDQNAILITQKKKMICCFWGGFMENGEGQIGWHRAYAKFMINLAGELCVEDTFGIDTNIQVVRKPTPAEMFQLIDALRRGGYRYDRKSKELIKLHA